MPSLTNRTSSTGMIKIQLKFTVGDTVEAKFGRGLDWFPGTIFKVDGKNKTYAIEYDDGATEYKVHECLVREKQLVGGVSAYNGKGEEEKKEQNSSIKEVPSVQVSLSPLVSNVVQKAEDDGWELVSAPTKKKDTNAPRFHADTGEEILTKKQRESRRRKDALREKKDIAREQAQEKGLHAKWGGSLNPSKKF